MGKHFVVCEAAACQTGFRLHLEGKICCGFDSLTLDNRWCLVVEKVKPEGKVKMKPSQGFELSLVSLQMRVMRQLFVLIGLLTSTVVITRMIVLGNVSPSDIMLECEKDASNPSCTGSRNSQLTNHTFPYQEALEMSTTDNNIQRYVLSAMEKRYDYASIVTKKLNITAQQFIPHSYKSQLVYDSLEKFQNSTKYHDNSLNLKMFSHRLAHTDMLNKFVSDQTAKLNTWRLFFEDDMELHPNVAANMAKEFLAKGLQLASGDGILYLGICGPAKTNEREALSEGIEAGRTSGLCTHAKALQSGEQQVFFHTSTRSSLFTSATSNSEKRISTSNTHVNH